MIADVPMLKWLHMAPRQCALSWRLRNFCPDRPSSIVTPHENDRMPSLKLTQPLKMMVSNRNLLFHAFIFRDMLVSRRVSPENRPFEKGFHLPTIDVQGLPSFSREGSAILIHWPLKPRGKVAWTIVVQNRAPGLVFILLMVQKSGERTPHLFF